MTPLGLKSLFKDQINDVLALLSSECEKPLWVKRPFMQLSPQFLFDGKEFGYLSYNLGSLKVLGVLL